LTKINRMKVADLKLALRSLLEPTTANKPQLVERLRARLMGHSTAKDAEGVRLVRQAVDAAYAGNASPIRADPYPVAPPRPIPKGPPVPPLVPVGISPAFFPQAPTFPSPFQVPSSVFGTKTLVDNVKFKHNPFYDAIKKIIPPRVTEGTC